MEIYINSLTIALFFVQPCSFTTLSVTTKDSHIDLTPPGDVALELLKRVNELVSIENQRKAEMEILRAIIRRQEVRISELEHAQKVKKYSKDTEVNALHVTDGKQATRFAEFERTFDETRLGETKGTVTDRKPTLFIVEIPDVEFNVTTTGNEKDSVRDRGRKLIKDREGRSRQRRQDVVYDVAFYAVVDSHHLTNLGANQRIEFDRVVTNIGNAYRPDIGAFISPVSGTYVFSATLMGLNHHNAHYYISRNGEAVANMFIHGQDSYLSSCSRTVVLYLNKGDEVSVRNMNVTEGVFGFQFSSFSGFLKGTEPPAKAILG